MSNLSDRPLRISYQDLSVAASCNESAVDLFKQGRRDDCHVAVTVTDRHGKRKPEDFQDTYLLRFDRKFTNQKIDFELAIAQDASAGQAVNSQEAINWFFRHSDSSAKILDIVRVMGSTLDAAGVSNPNADARASNARIPLLIANYIVTGNIVFPGDVEGQGGGRHKKARTSSELDKILLDVFANSPAPAVQDIIGKIAYFKADSGLSQEARGRAIHVDNILIHVPKYKQFLDKLVPAELQKTFDLNHEMIGKDWSDIQTFVARAIVDLNDGRFFVYDSQTYAAYEAYGRLVGDKNKKKGFCMALKHAYEAVSGKRQSRLGEHFVEECRNGIKLSQMSPSDAVKESVRHYLLSARGLKDIRSTVPQETRKSKMTPDWLAKRGQINNVAKQIISHLDVKITYETKASRVEGPLTAEQEAAEKAKKKIKKVKVKVDAAALRTAIRLLINNERARKHREPIMAALGVLRLIFGKDAKNNVVTVLVNGEYQEVPLIYDRAILVSTLKSLEAELKVSFRRSDILWPVLQGTSGAAGITGIGLGLGLKNASKPARQGLFTAGCSTAGFALGSLVQHSKKAKNKHVWGGVGGTVGMVLIGGACATIATQTSLFNSPGSSAPNTPSPDQRNPVDDYGP